MQLTPENGPEAGLPPAVPSAFLITNQAKPYGGKTLGWAEQLALPSGTHGPETVTGCKGCFVQRILSRLPRGSQGWKVLGLGRESKKPFYKLSHGPGVGLRSRPPGLLLSPPASYPSALPSILSVTGCKLPQGREGWRLSPLYPALPGCSPVLDFLILDGRAGVCLASQRGSLEGARCRGD